MQNFIFAKLSFNSTVFDFLQLLSCLVLKLNHKLSLCLAVTAETYIFCNSLVLHNF